MKKGFALLVAIVVTSILLIVSFVVSNIALKQLVIATTNKDSQKAFYAANSGVECAHYWDLTNPLVSPFATSTGGTITCNGQTISTGNQSVPTVPVTPSLIGGGGDGSPTSIFMIPVVTNEACAVVRVTKVYVGSVIRTTIDSRGYNTCNVTAARRVERGITLTY